MRLLRFASILAVMSFATVSVFAQSQAAVDSLRLPDDPGAQETAVWCWAASISYIFAYYKHAISQCEIVSQYYGGCPAIPGNPKTMGISFNRRWKDDQGDTFTANAAITDEYWNSSHAVDNNDVIDALDNDKPVFYGTTNHAMVLLSVMYYRTPNGPMIVSGKVWDPNPIYHRNGGDGIRAVSGQDLQAKYVAIPNISSGHTSKVVPADHKERPDPVVTPTEEAADLCRPLNDVISDGSNSFQSIIGEKRKHSSWYDTDTLLPAAKECWIEPGSTHKSYNCSYPKGTYRDLAKNVKACLVKDGHYANSYVLEGGASFMGKGAATVNIHDRVGGVVIEVREILASDTQ